MPHRARPRPRWIVAVTIAWTSFVAAGVGTALFFATFDPHALVEAQTFPFELSRLGAYTLGFVLFWIFGAATATVAHWLLAAAPHRADVAEAPDGS